ncbi:MAG: hypothetical protein EXR80_03010 [Methylococcales bacterium]|nr:hypothetical protein [Methylococcales bacterium]
MQAIELNAVIMPNHEIHLKLPDDITVSHAKVIIMYENEKPLAKKWDRFFASKSFLMMIVLQKETMMHRKSGSFINAHA